MATTEPLFRYQEEDISRAVPMPNVYISHEMGLGKSRTAIEIAKRRKATSILICCPKSALLVWRRELKKWWPDCTATVEIVPYSMLSLAASATFSRLATRKFDLTILDESHFLKNPKARRTKAVSALVPNLGRTILLSGTPAPNNASELYPVLKAFFPHVLKYTTGQPIRSKTAFEDAFCYVQNKRFGKRVVRVITGTNPTTIPILRSMIEPVMLRRIASEVFKDMPPLRWQTVPVVVSQKTIKLMAEFDDIVNDDMTDEEILAALSNSANFMRVRAALGAAKVEGALDYIAEYLDGIEDTRKFTAWGHHHVVLDNMQQGLEDMGIGVVRIDGSTSDRDRAEAVDRFTAAGGPRCFLGQIQAAGTAITLNDKRIKVRDCFFVEGDFTPTNNWQAASRIRRIGQTEPVLARMFAAHQTIDMRVQDILTRKARDFVETFN